VAPQLGHVVPAVPASAACRRSRRSASRLSRRRASLAERWHALEQKRWGDPPLRPAMNAVPHVSQCRSSPILWDANLAPLQAQGRLPSLQPLRADAGDNRAADICLSSTGRPSGVARTWRRRPGISAGGGRRRGARAAPAGDERAACIWPSSTARSNGSAQTSRRSPDRPCRRCPPSLPGRQLVGARCVRLGVVSFAVRLPPCARTLGSRIADLSAMAGMPCHMSRKVVRRTFERR
jgi:hypothetical protein